MQIEWINALPADQAYPITAVTAPDGTQNEPGRSGRPANATVAELVPWTVVHLHGGRTAAVSDGWTENAILSGQSTTSDYANDQQATLLWYHDHAMGITRFNVYAGLAGLYIIRDAEEAALHLPAGPYEIPLLIQDRNRPSTARARRVDVDRKQRLQHRPQLIGDPKPGRGAVVRCPQPFSFLGFLFAHISSSPTFFG